MQEVFGGAVNVVDTESRRALHYASDFKFEHTPFDPPYSPGDYSDVLVHVKKLKPGIVIIDQLSYEHDGIGGVLEMHETELDRMAGNDYSKRDRMKMAAWIKPKQDRRRLINELVQIGSDFAIILLFRAKETAKPVKNQNTGKIEIEDQGFLPIAAPEFLFEATASCVLYPGSNGIPTWQTEFKGERLYMKLPGQFRDILAPGKQLSEEMGRNLALWAKGAPPPAPPRPLPELIGAGDAIAEGGTESLRAWWSGNALTNAEKLLVKDRLDGWKGIAKAKETTSA